MSDNHVTSPRYQKRVSMRNFRQINRTSFALPPSMGEWL